MISITKIGKQERIARAPTERFNVMMVGESASGKTTASMTLLRNFDELRIHDGMSREEVEVLIDETGKTLNIGRLGIVDTTIDPSQPSATHIYDSKGYGDHVNNQSDFDAIRNYIVEKHRKYYSTPLHGLTADQQKEIDDRIHCCLYFISPHRMKRIDEIFIESLADVVNIVPIIAKADTMTMDERDKFLKEVVARISLIQRRVREKHDLRAIFQFDLSDASVKFMKKKVVSDNPESHLIKAKSAGKFLNDSKGRSILELFPRKPAGEPDDDDDQDDEEFNCSEVCEEHPPVSDVYNDFGLQPCQLASELDQQISLQGNASNQMLTDIVRARNIFAIFSAPNLCRAYPWGVAEVERLDHNDFPLLKEHLFRIDSIRDMIESTTRRSELLFKREKEKEKERMETLESIEEIEKNEIDRKKEEEELIELENQRRIEEEIERRVMEIKEELEQERDEEQRTLEEKIKLRIEEEVQYRLKTTSNSTLRQYSSIAWKDVSLFLLTIHFLYSCYHQRALSSYLGELD